ncbi:RE1-silencing transcription factor [Ursus maritimus]|uniref:RE1-silencing transcription factor n=1 Tax=Ursus maritimus TaxID=29073 RepID=A0A8M1FKU6_URSMA|nr:RE1-silencing transcription factor [Ursus maritimus]XP_040481169.1 RE1-silencing transcription factor [Ursus maritimus]
MATQVMGQSSGGGGLFTGSGNMGMALPNDMYDLHDLSKAELAAPQLIMLANVALTGEVNGSCCDYLVGEERQMAELMPVADNNFSDSDGEGLEESPEIKGEPSGLENMELESLELSVVEPQPVFEVSAAPEIYSSNKDLPPETPGAEDKCKNLKSKPFRCKPCQYEAESEEQFVHHIRVHSAKKFFVEESAEKQAKARESGSSTAEEGDFSKGPIRCDRCGYNTNRYDHYTAHLKHHTRAGDNERVYKCIICTYTTVSEYHWRKHLRNHFPRKVYTCGKCNYFSDRKNNYVQHVRTHTGERPYKCELCPYSSSQKTHLTRHMRTHSGEKPFKCDQCSYVASNQHEVTRHARQVHNGPKPLNCPHCDYKTADRSNFKKHVELHVNPRQFNCPVCDYAASKKCNLQYHFKSKHPTCPNKTMDVSKVKLKKTKKREADLPDNNITNEKKETEQTKIKGDVAGKKNERSVKVEKKDNVSKEKKACSNASTQVTTRTRKSAMETKEMDVQTGNNSETTCKTKKSKRRMEAEAHSLKDPVNDEEPVTKKKKKAENKSKNGQEMPKGDNKVEETKKQNTCMKKSTKKKSLKNKSSKKSSKPAQKGPAQLESSPSRKPAQMEPSPPRGPAQMEPSPSRRPAHVDPSPSRKPAQMEPSPPRGPAPMELSPSRRPAHVDPSPSRKPAQMEPSPPRGPAPMELSPSRRPAHVDPSPSRKPAQMEPSPPRGPAPMELSPSRRPAHVDPSPSRGPAQVEPSPPRGPAQVEASPPRGPAQMEPSPPRGPAQMEPSPPRAPAQMEPSSRRPAQMESSPSRRPAQVESSPPRGSAQMEPSPPRGPAQMEPSSRWPAQMESSPSRRPAQVEPSPPRGPAQMEFSPPRGPAQLEPSPPRGPAQMELPTAMESAQMDVGQMEPPPPMESAQIGSAQTETPPPVGPAQMEVVQMEPPPPTEPPLHIEPSPKKSPRKDNKKEKSSIQSEMARKEQVLIEVGLVPVKDSQLLKEGADAQDLSTSSTPPPKENLKEEESKDQKLLTEGKGSNEAPLQKVEEAEKSVAGLAAIIKESANISSSEQNLTMQEGEILDAKCQSDTVPCEMEMDADENKAENPPGKDPAVEEPVSPVLLPLPIENHEAVSKTAMTSPPVTMAVHESQEMDEDEGIHSHDGSDLSDNMSEGSDDSGLNGARPVPQETSRKNAKEALAVKVAEGDFVCIFCDRSFRKEKDYSKHLNRHLVNVYFLEKAAKGQE